MKSAAPPSSPGWNRRIAPYSPSSPMTSPRRSRAMPSLSSDPPARCSAAMVVPTAQEELAYRDSLKRKREAEAEAARIRKEKEKQEKEIAAGVRLREKLAEAEAKKTTERGREEAWADCERSPHGWDRSRQRCRCQLPDR